VGRFWSLLFLLVPVLGVLTFVCAMGNFWPLSGGAFAFPSNHWLPENINDHGTVIDRLFLFILVLTGVIFVGTSLALFWFMWKYDAEKTKEAVVFSHGSHTLEIVWSILPAVTLLFIAIYQMNAWAEAKMFRPMLPGPDGQSGTADDLPKPPLLRVTGRQFEWRLRYAGQDGMLDTTDDILLVNDMHIPVDEETVVEIETQDVLHSFFLPNMRVKQDMVPGMRQFTWFRANKSGVYDIVCAELCGWGHYKMRGRLTVEPREKFNQWLAGKLASQETSQFVPKVGEEE
jgi:cytochrome c oxidase subunit 2